MIYDRNRSRLVLQSASAAAGGHGARHRLLRVGRSICGDSRSVGAACSWSGNDLDTKRVALGSTWRLTPAVCCRSAAAFPRGDCCGHAALSLRKIFPEPK